jgi:hypothetical protein
MIRHLFASTLIEFLLNLIIVYSTILNISIIEIHINLIYKWNSCKGYGANSYQKMDRYPIIVYIQKGRTHAMKKGVSLLGIKHPTSKINQDIIILGLFFYIL